MLPILVERSNSVSKCSEWLKGHLSAGMSECNGVRESAKAAGFNRKELKAARKELGVKTWHQIDTEGYPKIENWFWYFPEDER